MGFEHLRAYQAAEALDREILRILPLIRLGHSSDLNQLRRALASITFNIAEAYGNEHRGRKAYFLEIAKGSTDETRAILQRLARVGALERPEIYKASALTRVSAKLLAAWIKTLA